MPIYKRCSRCGQRIPSGTKCPCKSKRYVEEDKYKKNTREEQFYSSGQWKKIRKKAIDNCNGLDLYSYYILGRIEYGTTVHHIEPIKENWDRRLDISNLIYLTEANHQLIHEAMNGDINEKKRIMDMLHDILDKNALKWE